MKLLSSIVGLLFFQAAALHAQSSFIVAELDSTYMLVKEGNCDERISPCSTFKIALSLMGYDTAILHDDTTPEWAYMEHYKTWNETFLKPWGQPQNPTTWVQNSCIWYSQLLTKQMGIIKLQKYVDAFNYGNKDLSGEPGRNDGLTHSWLSSSLKISVREQIDFLKKLLHQEFPVSPRAHEMTKKILFVDEIKEGWELYAKTGSGLQRKKDGKIDMDRQLGWYVGWLEHPNGTLVFAFVIQDDAKESTLAVTRAKTLAKATLLSLKL